MSSAPIRSMPRVRESVAAHRISDVKVGSFLSGGVDSSYITACLMPDETFSVGFASPDGTHKFDETTEAGGAFRQARHQELPRDADQGAVP